MTGPWTIWLSPEAVRGLAAVPRVDGNPFAIPERIGGETMRNLKDPWEIACQRAALENLRIHREDVISLDGRVGRSIPEWEAEV